MKHPLHLLIVAGLAQAAAAQSLFEMPPAGSGAPAPAAPAPALPLDAVSLYAIQPPEPRTFQENDQITIIISEKNKLERSQSLDTEKDYQLDAAITQFLDLTKMLELRFNQQEETAELPMLGAGFNTKTENEGNYEREDTLTARVTARVVEVKPNGVLLIEARTTTITDNEVQTITLAGFCRQEDVTVANTVQSNQLYDMTLNVQHEGDVKRAAKKGLIPSFFDAIFGL
ncbi:MAG: flagellar basal body L-ring protein FlgH [Phycisphaerales bacterium]|nr:flagellar basal body L-ring protein FlgH [Phycisphaerales bacterium]